MPISERQLKQWISNGDPVFGRSDGGGLTFTLSKAGKATWVFRYRFGGKPRELKLGDYPDLPLVDNSKKDEKHKIDARRLARWARLQIDQGVDPALARNERVKQQAEELDRAKQTLAWLADQWYREEVESELRHPKVVERVLRNHMKPALGSIPATDVRPGDLARMLKRIKRGGAPTIANDALRYLRAMFAFGRKHEYVTHDPARDLRLIDAGGKENARERALTKTELMGLFKAMRETETLGRENGLAFKILLATCVRKGELVGARWSEFDLAAGIWRLPSERTKTHSAIDIPLAAPIVAWLRELKVFSAGSEYVLPARRITEKRRFRHISPDTLNVALKRVRHGLEAFTIHDMRRTARTHLAALGVPREIAERALNHELKGVERIYNQHDYFDERKQALAVWADLLLSLGAGEPGQQEANVVPLPSRRAA